jgi:5-methylcytosine-specific restriction protein A
MARLTNQPNRVTTVDTRTVKPPLKTTDPFYGSAAWQALRARIIQRDGGTCQLRLPGCAGTQPRMYVDHKREITDGGAKLDPSNLWTACAPCHTRKTNAARDERFRRGPR